MHIYIYIQIEIQQSYVKIKSFCVKYELEKQYFTVLLSTLNSSGRTRKDSLSSRGDDLKGMRERAMWLRKKEKSDYNFNSTIAVFSKLYDSRKDWFFLHFVLKHAVS